MYVFKKKMELINYVFFIGFRGIWGSGLAISAQLGVRDSNEASWSQVTDIVEYMADASTLPILLDADTGYGNFNNCRRLIRKLEKIGVAGKLNKFLDTHNYFETKELHQRIYSCQRTGCCIEDKIFPKTNSLLDNRKQPLANMNEFAMKIKVLLNWSP